MNFGPCTPCHSILPRGSAYYNELTSRLIELDYTKVYDENLMQFGKSKVNKTSSLFLLVFFTDKKLVMAM